MPRANAGRGSNPNSRKNLISGQNKAEYYVTRDGLSVAGPYTWGRAYELSTAKNYDTKSNIWGVRKGRVI